MAYSHSFTRDFYDNGKSYRPAEKPTTVWQALASIPDREWSAMCRALGQTGDMNEMMALVKKTDTVTSLKSPVEVWIDVLGIYTVLVHDVR